LPRAGLNDGKLINHSLASHAALVDKLDTWLPGFALLSGVSIAEGIHGKTDARMRERMVHKAVHGIKDTGSLRGLQIPRSGPYPEERLLYAKHKITYFGKV